MKWLWFLLFFAALGGSLACDRPEAQAKRPAGYIVDSTVPRAEMLRRFQAELTPVQRSSRAGKSRDALVEDYVKALTARDTTALAALAVSRAEFAYLYYPTTPQGLPPYSLDPGLMWSLLVQRSNRGVKRALAVYGGEKLTLLGYDCGTGSSVEGANTIWGPCEVRLRRGKGDTVSRRLFSQIIERGGRYKFLNYTNKL